MCVKKGQSWDRLINETVSKFLKHGIVQHSNSPYNAHTIIVAKKDMGTRMCVDFRRLNAHLITDRHPLPRISQILEQLGGAVYLTVLDLLRIEGLPFRKKRIGVKPIPVTVKQYSKTSFTEWYAKPSRAPTLICLPCCAFFWLAVK